MALQMDPPAPLIKRAQAGQPAYGARPRDEAAVLFLANDFAVWRRFHCPARRSQAGDRRPLDERSVVPSFRKNRALLRLRPYG